MRVWSWSSFESKPQKRAIFDISWQQHEDVDRVALSLQSHKVGLIDLKQVPALKVMYRLRRAVDVNFDSPSISF